jgi:diguanylate cyclase (GGDEF)-like protein
MLAYAGLFLSAILFGVRTRWSFAMMAVPVLFLCGAAVKMLVEQKEPRFRVPGAIATVLLLVQIVLLLYRVGLSLTPEHGVRARTAGWSDPQWMYSMLGIMVVGYCLLLVYVLFTAIEIYSHVAWSAGQDALTGSMNRRALLKHVGLEVERSERMGRPLAVICMDLDHFKRVNDTFGHGGGDAVLCAFVSLAKERLRGEDVVARTGGEEFMVVLPGMDAATAASVAERLRLDVEQMRVEYEGRVISTTVSAGVTERLGPEDCWVSMTKRADRLLYQAKSSGRNRVAVEEPAAMMRFIAAAERAEEKATVG